MPFRIASRTLRMTDNARTELEGFCLDCVKNRSKNGEQRTVRRLSYRKYRNLTRIGASGRTESGLLVQRLVSRSQWRGCVIPQNQFLTDEESWLLIMTVSLPMRKGCKQRLQAIIRDCRLVLWPNRRVFMHASINQRQPRFPLPH